MWRLKAVTAAAPSRSRDRQRADQLGQQIGAEAKTNRRKTQRRGRAPSAISAKRGTIPSPIAAGFLSLYDGQSLLATYVERDGSHFLFDSSGVLIGSFKSYSAAIAALPAVQS